MLNYRTETIRDARTGRCYATVHDLDTDQVAYRTHGHANEITATAEAVAWVDRQKAKDIAALRRSDGSEKMSDKEVKTCTTPGCKKPPKASRGLCYTCAGYLHNGTDKHRRAVIQQHMLPSRRGGRKAKAAVRPPAAPRSFDEAEAPVHPATAPQPLDEAEQQQKAVDEVIATCCEVCTILGMERVNRADGRVFVNPANGKAAELTNSGLIYTNELRRLAG